MTITLNVTQTPSIPESYELVVTHLRCACCGYVERRSHFMAITHIRSRHAIGEPVRHSVRIDAPEYNLPVTIRKVNGPAMPFCGVCPTISLAHLPLPPQAAALTDLPDPVLKVAKSRPTTPPPRRKPTIEELA